MFSRFTFAFQHTAALVVHEPVLSFNFKKFPKIPKNSSSKQHGARQINITARDF